MALSAPAALQPAEWTQADLLIQGRTTRLGRRDARNLVNRVVALTAANAAPRMSTNSSANPSAVADGGAIAAAQAARNPGALLLRLQLLDQGNPAAVAQFELRGDNYFRWQRAGQLDVSGALTDEAVAGLSAAAAKLVVQ